jgi:CHRD domain-containing protein
MRWTLLAPAILSAACFTVPANAEEFSARLTGFQEIGGLGAGETGAIFSPGKGTLQVDLNKNAHTLTYTLTYSGLVSPILQAHIHFGKIHVAGGIMVFLCTNLGNGPAGTPACPANGGTVSGTLNAASVVGPAGQGVSAGNFDAVEAALESDTAYGNVHSATFTAGEIRGQLRRSERED